jgi:hypothetical protein
MIVLGYIGKHKGKGFKAWAGWALIRAAQVGRTWRRVTHTEILLGGTWDHATIASSSLVDGGVRIRQGVHLTPGHWVALELPEGMQRSTALAQGWFERHLGWPYDARGALGSVLFGLGSDPEGYFCNEACGAALRQTDPHKMPPAGFMAWCADLGGVDVTDEFFKGASDAAG